MTGPWNAVCLPPDGGRISRLTFDGVDLLTAAPVGFRPPGGDCGRYESRPVYGYDDCFPTVDECSYPARDGLDLPDHGELCWLGWKVDTVDNQLLCSTRSSLLPVVFRRTMVFEEASLSWRFEVENTGTEEVAFLHVMHALMPLADIAEVDLPTFKSVFDEMNDRFLAFDSPEQLTSYLFGMRSGEAAMLLLRDVGRGEMKVRFKNGLGVTIEFPVELFPTFGIWWNNAGYPDKDGPHRTECAFEPIPGSFSSLERSCENGACLKVPPHGKLNWTIDWTITSQ